MSTTRARLGENLGRWRDVGADTVRQVGGDSSPGGSGLALARRMRVTLFEFIPGRRHEWLGW